MRSRRSSLGMRARVAACAALLVAGCSSGDGRPAPSAGTSWIDFYIERAELGQSSSGTVASAQQIEILARGRVQGELTMADVTEAIHNSSACLEGLVLSLTMGAPQARWGGPRNLSPEEIAAMGDPCLDAESFFVEQAYVAQPRAIEAADNCFDEHMRSTMVEPTAV